MATAGPGARPMSPGEMFDECPPGNPDAAFRVLDAYLEQEGRVPDLVYHALGHSQLDAIGWWKQADRVIRAWERKNKRKVPKIRPLD